MIIDRKVCMLGVPMDLGGGRRGVDMGPSALRIAGIGEGLRGLGVDFEDLGNVPVDQLEAHEPANPRARYIDEIAKSCADLRDRVGEILRRDAFPLVVGGDHSIACGTVAAVSSHFHERGEKIGLLWFDAHGDFNTPETSPSGNVHGMPLASSLGYGPEELTELCTRFPMVDPEKSALVGVHSLDSKERELILEAGIKVFTVRHVDIMGMHEVMTEALAIVTDGTAGFHLSFDVDGSDPVHAPGVGTPVSGGMTERESMLVMEHAAESRRLLSLELTEINPILDVRNKTAEFARELALSALGKMVL